MVNRHGRKMYPTPDFAVLLIVAGMLRMPISDRKHTDCVGLRRAKEKGCGCYRHAEHAGYFDGAA
jgi:hypothetical protein